MTKALGVVYRCLATHQIQQAGLTHRTAKTGAVTFIQRFGSALNLNIHFHILFLDGVYVTRIKSGQPVFRPVKAPSKQELETLLHRISTRLARFLVKEGVLTQDLEHSYLDLGHLEEDPLRQVHGHSITYRIAVGPQQGRKVFTLQTVLPREEDDRFRQVAKAGGFSLHAGVATQAHQRSKLERICRYVARPAVSERRLALTRDGRVRYALKTPYQDGATHVIFEPLDFMYRMYGMPRAQGCAGAAIARLAALIPKPRVHLQILVIPPSLYHPVINNPMKNHAVIKPVVHIIKKIPDHTRGLVLIQFYFQGTHCSLQGNPGQIGRLDSHPQLYCSYQ
jgi:hypothetical protein